MTPPLRPALEAIRDALRDPGARSQSVETLRATLDADQRWSLAVAAFLALDNDDLTYLADTITIAAAQRRQERAQEAADARAIHDAIEAEALAHEARMARRAIGIDTWREAAAKAATDEEAA